jgi:hypothetical protein
MSKTRDEKLKKVAASAPSQELFINKVKKA